MCVCKVVNCERSKKLNFNIKRGEGENVKKDPASLLKLLTGAIISPANYKHSFCI